MSVDVHWYLPGYIIYSYDELTVENRTERNRKIWQLLETGGQPPKVHVLIDFNSTGHGNYTMNLQKMTERQETNPELKQSVQQLAEHPLLGWVVSIGEGNPALTTAATVLAVRNKYRRQSVATLADALEFLKRADSSLIDKLPKPTPPTPGEESTG